MKRFPFWPLDGTRRLISVSFQPSVSSTTCCRCQSDGGSVWAKRWDTLGCGWDTFVDWYQIFAAINVTKISSNFSFFPAELPTLVWPPGIWAGDRLQVFDTRGRWRALDTVCQGERPELSLQTLRGWRRAWCVTLVQGRTFSPCMTFHPFVITCWHRYKKPAALFYSTN